MVFSKTTGYGIRALAYLAKQPKDSPRGLQEIAKHEGIPPVYLRKVLGELRRHRLLRSLKGIRGGYELARSAEDITLWDVFRVLEPDPYLDTCILGHRPCNAESACPLHEDWLQVRKGILRLLENKTIAEIAVTGSRAAGEEERAIQ